MQAGLYYHIYNRAINKELLFYEDRNYKYFLNQFHRYLSHHLEVYSYCLMPNHFHFLVKVQDYFQNNLSTLPKQDYENIPAIFALKDFFISYAKSINKSYNRTGSLFQYKFKRKIINHPGYLTKLIAYIHLNPVRDGLCKNPENWKYSSYNAILGTGKTKVNREEIFNLFSDKEAFINFHKEYRDYQITRDYLYKE